DPFRSEERLGIDRAALRDAFLVECDDEGAIGHIPQHLIEVPPGRIEPVRLSAIGADQAVAEAARLLDIDQHDVRQKQRNLDWIETPSPPHGASRGLAKPISVSLSD